MIVEIPGIGEVEFPDTMSEAEVNAAASKLYQQAQAPPQQVQAPQPSVAADSRPQVGTLRGLAGQASQGGLAGFGDELRGYYGSLLDNYGHLVTGNPQITDASGESIGLLDSYRRNRDLARGEFERYAEENPGASLSANLGGALTTGLAGGGVAAGTQVGRNVALGLAGLPFRSRVAASIPIGGAGGAVGGALAGAGEAPEIEGVPRAAGEGALLGAALGAAAGPVGEGLVTGGQKAIGALGRRLMPSADDRANAAIRRAVERQSPDAPLPASEAAGQLERLGGATSGATLGDTGSSTLGLLDSMASQPGQTGDLAGRQLARRSRNQINDLTDAIGSGRAADAIDESRAFRTAQASPIYERAFQRGITHNDELQEVFTTIEDLLPGAWNKAKRFGRAELRNEGSDLGADALGDAVPSLRGWQFVKRRLDDAVDSARRQGNADEARVLESTRSRLLRELDSQSPDFATARGMWAGSKSFDDAIESGQRFMREPSSVTQRQIDSLSDADREGYTIGAVQAMNDVLESGGFTTDVTRRLRTPRMERKLKALLGPEQFSDFMNRIEASRVMQSTFGRVGQGSQTAARAAQVADQGMANAVLGAGADLLQGESLARTGLNRGSQMLRNSPIGGMPESARDLIGRRLLETDPDEQLRILQQAFARRPPVPASGAGLLPATAGAGLGLGAGLLSTRQ